MLGAELILAYAIYTNQPLYLREDTRPYRDWEVRLDLTNNIHWLDVKLSPYLFGGYGPGNFIGITGVHLELSTRIWKEFYIGYHHNSEHNTDRTGAPSRADRVFVKWKMK